MSARKPLSLKSVAGKATPAERVVSLCVAGALVSEHAALVEELEGMQATDWEPQKLNEAPPSRALAEKIVAVEAKMRDQTYPFVFRRIKPQAWRDLMDAHPGREGKNERADLTTFPAAAVRASLVAADPEFFDDFWDGLSKGQQDELFNGAWDVNEGAVSIPFSVAASAALQTSVPNSTTAVL